MSYLVRNQNDVLGPNSAIELPNGASASEFVGTQLIEVFPFFSAAAPAAGSQVMFIVPPAPSSASGTLPLGKYLFLGAQVFYTTASTSGTLQFFHDTGTQAPGAGTAISASQTLGTAGPLTVYVPQSSGLALATQVFSPGDRLSFTLGGTLTGQANLSVSVYVARAAQLGGGIAY